MADILIHGMEMPETCWNCKLKVGFSACGLVTDHKDGGFFYRVHEGKSRPDWCPLLPLPEGHGDLIDLDAFRAENGLNAKCEHCPTNTYECQRDMIHTKMEYCGKLADAPVIVPAEGGDTGGE